MNATLSKPPGQGAATTGIVPTTGLAPDSTPTDIYSAAPIAGPGAPITLVDSIDPPAAGGPGGQQ